MIVIRKIVIIDEERCNGCGLCVKACHEAALRIIDGKAKLVRDVYCDGLGACLPECPENAIRTEERECAAFDETAGRLNQWPVQLKLVAVSAPYFKNADILISADCTAFTHGNFHNTFMKNKSTVIGCPKLDNCDYSEKLCELFTNNCPKSITVAIMEVPCCASLVAMAESALKKSGMKIPFATVVISLNGEIS